MGLSLQDIFNLFYKVIKQIPKGHGFDTMSLFSFTLLFYLCYLIDAFQTLAGQWDDRVDFVSVLTFGGTPEFAAAVVQEHEFTIPVVIDLTDSLWNPLSIPNWVLIDSEGRALGGWAGGSDTQILNQLLEQFLQ